jgi:hypothetical protein
VSVSKPVSKPPEETPLVLIKGDATEEEVAALVAVLQGVAAATAAAAAASDDAAAVSQWASPHRKVRASYPHGPGGWRASALPR